MVQALPLLGDVAGQLPGPVATRLQSMARGRPPHPCRRVTQNLVSPHDRQVQLEQRRTQPLQQQRAHLAVVAEQGNASPTAGQAQGRDLVASPASLQGNEDLQHGRSPGARRRLGDVRLRGARERTPDTEVPLPLEPGHDRGKVLEPAPGTGGDRVIAEHVRDVDQSPLTLPVTCRFTSDSTHPPARALERSRQWDDR
ncbi:hypothetical protein GCM10011575_21560 [Microlunatus endophyticus]|uniref:Uncharacterized protein n=1 Tax=Microlunatus endophyticus TaxID=1716077 RepID=A0A917S9H9_9ACTN|nr:hypothetical protein GCM10011575_21560 [Microlunatus endophyticus]